VSLLIKLLKSVASGTKMTTPQTVKIGITANVADERDSEFLSKCGEIYTVTKRGIYVKLEPTFESRAHFLIFDSSSLNDTHEYKWTILRRSTGASEFSIVDTYETSHDLVGFRSEEGGLLLSDEGDYLVRLVATGETVSGTPVSGSTELPIIVQSSSSASGVAIPLIALGVPLSLMVISAIVFVALTKR